MKFLFEEALSDKDQVSLFGWSESVFPVEGYKYIWANPTHRIVAREQGVAVAHLGFASFTLKKRAKTIKVIGVGSVVVRPEYQGKNIPSTLFSMLHNSDVLESKKTVSSLFCPQRLTSYYAKHGYSIFAGRVTFLQKEEYVETNEYCFMLRGASDFTGIISIPSEPW